MRLMRHLMSKSVLEGSHSITLGAYTATIGFKKTRTDSELNDSNDKEELEITASIAGVRNELNDDGCRQLLGGMQRVVSATEDFSNLALTAARASMNLLSGGSLFTGTATVPDISSSTTGNLGLTFKWEKSNGSTGFSFKEFAVTFGYSLGFEGRARFPIPGTPLMGEGTSAFNAEMVRTIFFLRY